MPLTIDDLFTPLTPDEVLSAMLSIGVTLGLDVSAWQPGQPGRTILVITAQKIADATAIIATMNKGGFLDYAASVTPEGGPGWLDILALAVYRVTRIAATYAATPLTFTCVSASPGTFAPGDLHATTPSGSTYTNTGAVILPANGIVSVDVAADVSGAVSSAGTGQINRLVTPQIGVTVSNATPAVGSDAETNAALVSRCKAKLASLSTEGPSGAYDYAARTINGDNQVPVSSGPLTQPANPATRTATVTDNNTGAVTTYVASAIGAYATPPNYTGDFPKQVGSYTNGAPIVNVQLVDHGYNTGDRVFISGANSSWGVNGAWTVNAPDTDNFYLVGSTYVAGSGPVGIVERYSDLDLIDKSIQSNAVPDGVTAITLSAVPSNVTVVGTLYVTAPASNLPDSLIVSRALAALALLASKIPIGGVGIAAQVYVEAIRTAAFNANAGTVNVTLSLPLADVTAPPGGVVAFSPAPTFAVVRV